MSVIAEQAELNYATTDVDTDAARMSDHYKDNISRCDGVEYFRYTPHWPPGHVAGAAPRAILPEQYGIRPRLRAENFSVPHLAFMML
jgi:hypothetical protein